MEIYDADPKVGGGAWMLGLTLALGGLLFSVILLAADRQNGISRDLRRSQVEAALAVTETDFNRTVRDYGWWDEAHDRLVLDGDAAWGKANIGEWLGRSTDLAFTLAVDGDDRMLFAHPTPSVNDIDGLPYLIDAARANAAEFGRPTTGYLRHGDRLVLAAASVLRRSTIEGQGSRAVLVAAWDMEETVLPRLRRITRSEDLSLDSQEGEALPLTRIDGAIVARLHWQDDHPGTSFLLYVLPAAAASFLALVAMAWWQWGRARRHWRQLKAVDEMRTRLLAAIGHDLRQPLQSLALFAGVLEGRCSGPHARTALTNMHESLQRMGRLLDANLRLARLDLACDRLTTQPVDLDQVISEICMEMRPQAEVRGLVLDMVPTTAWVRSEPVLLASILRNLLSNAIRYTDKGRVLVGCRRRRGAVELWVCDTGIGIPPEKLDLVFEEFYQVGTCCGANTGVGLGLAIVRRLAKLLDHKVHVRSQLERGTVFSVGMKAAPTASASAAALATTNVDRPAEGAPYSS